MLLATREIKKIEKKLNGQVLLVATDDEEKGSENGIRWLIEKGIVKPNMAIIPDVTENHNITVAQKRLLHIKVISKVSRLL